MAPGDSIPMFDDDVVYQSYKNLNADEQKARSYQYIGVIPFPVILFDKKTGEVLDYVREIGVIACTTHRFIVMLTEQEIPS